MGKYNKELDKEFADRVIDEEALSVEDMTARYGMSRSWITKKAQAMVKAGKWERVFKIDKNSHRPVPAYRPKQK